MADDLIRYKLEQLLKPVTRDGTEALNAIRTLPASPQRPADLLPAIAKILNLHYRDTIPVEIAIDVIEAATERGDFP
jgi:hypothetical protein